tara:strand:+ start:417 stop:596 length:180 start_codon:yes stop_codon:yes gene_type:complete
MKTAVTVTNCVQIGIETWRDVCTTKVFDENATLGEIDQWVKSIDKTLPLSGVKFGDIVE